MLPMRQCYKIETPDFCSKQFYYNRQRTWYKTHRYMFPGKLLNFKVNRAVFSAILMENSCLYCPWAWRDSLSNDSLSNDNSSNDNSSKRQFIKWQFIEQQFIELTINRTDILLNRQFIELTIYRTTVYRTTVYRATVNGTHSLSNQGGSRGGDWGDRPPKT